MNQFKNIKEKVVNNVVKHKNRLEVFIITLLGLFSTSVYAYANISGENIKNNVLDNFVIPFTIIAVGILLLKEFIKKSVAGIVTVLVIGGLVLVVLSNPNIVTTIGNTIKAILGL